MPNIRTGNPAFILRLRPNPDENQCVQANACVGNFNGLVTEMTNRAGFVSSSVGVMVQHPSRSDPYHQREERDWQYEAPDSFSLNHLKDDSIPCHTADDQFTSERLSAGIAIPDSIADTLTLWLGTADYRL